MYAAANLPQAAFLKPTPQTFRQFLAQQNVFVFFVTVYVGAGLVANDRRANALQIYLSKPLSRYEYVFGKLAVLMTFQLMITWLPAIVLLVVQMAFAGSFAFLRDNLFLFPAITIYAFIEALIGAASMTALSSLSRNSRYVGVPNQAESQASWRSSHVTSSIGNNSASGCCAQAAARPVPNRRCCSAAGTCRRKW